MPYQSLEEFKKKYMDKEYQEHFSPDGERIQYLMEHPEESEDAEQATVNAWEKHTNQME